MINNGNVVYFLYKCFPEGVIELKIKNFFKKRKASLKQLAGSLMLLLMAGSVGVGLGLYETNGTKKYAMEAYDYYKDNNWVALYNYAELKDDDFVNEYFFEQLANNKYGMVDENTLELGSIDKKDDKAIVGSYYKDSQGNKIDCQFVMVKKPTKKYIFFDEWKLDISDLIVSKCKIVAPEGLAIYVDGVELTSNNSIIGYNGTHEMLEYVIPKIFKGEHTIFAKQDMLEVTEAVVTWNENGGEYVIDDSTFDIVEGVKTHIKSSSEMIIQLMYKNVFEETGVAGLDTYMLNSDDTKAVFTATYDKILAAIQPEDGSTLNSLSITGFDNHKIEYSHPYKALVSVDFACTFKARGPRNAANGARDKYEGEATSTITMEYVYDGSQWVCSTLSMDCIDYSKKEEVEEKK